MPDTDKTIEKIEEELFYEVDSGEVPPGDIFAYNELRSAADLYRMWKDDILEIDPDFQRGIVWKDKDQTRFIDSLLKELPIPSMCFSLDYKTQHWKVIDGLQRISTIIRFLEEDDWKLSSLTDVDKIIAGKTVREIKKKNPSIRRRVENITLPVTVLRCNYEKKSHSEYIFMIFHRLNSLGMRLNNQEIRNAIYSGPFNDFLKTCNRDPSWQTLLGIQEKENEDRFRRVELILRFFAFYERGRTYSGRLASFLNDYMHDNRYKKEEVESKRKLFQETVQLIQEKIASKEPLFKTSNVALESLMVGVAKNLDALKKKDKKRISNYYFKLMNSEPFLEENIREGILKKEKVLDRLKLAEAIFSGSRG